jgi:hypothetical protein
MGPSGCGARTPGRGLVPHAWRMEFNPRGGVGESSYVRPSHILHSGRGLMIPRIFYPIAADQPGNALLMTVKHEAAFELLSVRTGSGARRPYRRGDAPEPEFSAEGVRRETRELLLRMKGEEGGRVRRNVEYLADVYGRTWNDGCEAKRNLDGFLAKYIG